MKILWTLLLSFGVIPVCFGQLKPPKCDSIVYSTDSTKAIVYKKGKAGVYDLKGRQFLVKYNLSDWAYLAGRNLYIEVDETNYKLHYFSTQNNHLVFNANTNGVINLKFPDSTIEGHANTIEAVGGYFNLNTGERIDSIPEGYYYPCYFRIERLERDLFLIHDYAPVIAYLEFREIPIVAHKGYAGTGAFDIKSQSWQIKPEYQNCYKLKNLLFCEKHDSIPYETGEVWNAFDNNSWQFDIHHAYDIYRLEEGRYLLELEDIRSDDTLNLSTLMPLVGLKSCGDGLHYYFREKQQYGLMHFHLFSKRWDMAVDFRLDTVLPAVHDYIWYNAEHSKIMTYTKMLSPSLSLAWYYPGQEEGDTVLTVNQGTNELIVLTDTMMVDPEWYWEDELTSYNEDNIIIDGDSLQLHSAYDVLTAKTSLTDEKYTMSGCFWRL